MARRTAHVLVVGPGAPFQPLFKRLEATAKYRFEYAADHGTAGPFLRQSPDVVLVRLPAEEETVEPVLAWLESMKERMPVVGISCEKDMHYYLAAMEHGAFDYFTCDTPTEEVSRLLDNAIRWCRQKAA